MNPIVYGNFMKLNQLEHILAFFQQSLFNSLIYYWR